MTKTPKTFTDMWLAGWRAQLTFTAATLETMVAAQKSVLNATGQSVSASPGDMFRPMDGDRMREMFHEAAGANLRRWEDAADALQNLPDWYKDTARVPGSMMTDWFDKARRGT